MGITIAILLSFGVFLVGMKIRDKRTVAAGGFLVVVSGFVASVAA